MLFRDRIAPLLMIAFAITSVVYAGVEALVVVVPVIGGLVALIWGETPTHPTSWRR